MAKRPQMVCEALKLEAKRWPLGKIPGGKG